jgi:hypothetical protein
MFFKKGYITVNIKIRFVLDFAPCYAWVMDDKCYNMRTGRFIKQTESKGSYGYVINGKFMSCSSLREHLVKPK